VLSLWGSNTYSIHVDLKIKMRRRLRSHALFFILNLWNKKRKTKTKQNKTKQTKRKMKKRA
jgi:hypothetical protein